MSSLKEEFVERMITKRDIAAVLPPVFATYYAREMGLLTSVK
jgi:hypothetical protein